MIKKLVVTTHKLCMSYDLFKCSHIIIILYICIIYILLHLWNSKQLYLSHIWEGSLLVCFRDIKLKFDFNFIVRNSFVFLV